MAKYKFLHPSVFEGCNYDKGKVYELTDKEASALGEDSVVKMKDGDKTEVQPAPPKAVKATSDKMVKGGDNK